MAEAIKNVKVLQTIKESLDKNKISEIKATLEDLLSSSINIAVAGERGVEKMAFINAVRGLGDDEEGAAHPGGPDATKDPVVYPHPQQSEVRIWDLPPPQGDDFNPEEYLERLRVHRYSAFIVTAAQSFQPSCASLWKEMHRTGKALYFILLTTAKDSCQSLQEKKSSNVESLKKGGVEAPAVFLVSGSALEQLEFMDLLEVMEKEIPEIWMDALVISLPAFSVPMLRKKRAAFKAVVWTAASLSGGVSAIPIPMVSSMVDKNMLVKILTKARDCFGLDDRSLERLGKRVGRPVKELKAVWTSELSAEVSKDVVKKKLSAAEKEKATATKLLQATLKGSAKSATKSFTTMYLMLTTSLDELEEDAVKMLQEAFGEKD
ncbi:interferon-inducible GTPase 5-like [Amia ocellicauda]|uniref:interferon-inducible GTPase 5-like n=1 Tax=Amia ocellicauda TaxID=2972642 RepID=UPI003464E0DC|nr:IIGP5 GTPase [Amia calva]